MVSHRCRPLGIGLLQLLAYCCWRRINVNITLFLHVTLISNVQLTLDFDYFHALTTIRAATVEEIAQKGFLYVYRLIDGPDQWDQRDGQSEMCNV